MREFEPTPGEWTVEQRRGHNPLIVAATPDGPVTIAEVLDDCYPETEQQQDNARLIKAAPKLYAACRNVNDIVISDPTARAFISDAIRVVRAAISEAEGD